jgi:hypothetical protein
VTCRPGTPVDSFLCHVANMSADMSATRRPDRHMSVILTLVSTRRHPTLPAELGLSIVLGTRLVSGGGDSSVTGPTR